MMWSALKPRHDLVEFRPHALIERLRGLADIDETRDALAVLQAEALRDLGVVRGPLGQPVRDKPKRGRGDQHGLAYRARGQFLFPHGNRNTFAHPAYDAHDHRRAQEAGAFHREALGRRFLRRQAFGEHLAETRAGLALEQDEPPGEKLAVIGHARGRGQDRAQIVRVRSRPRHRLGRARAAGEQKVYRVRGGAVEGGGCAIHEGPMRILLFAVSLLSNLDAARAIYMRKRVFFARAIAILYNRYSVRSVPWR